MIWASLIALLVRNLPMIRRSQFDSWVGKISWRRDRLPTPVFLGFPCGSAGKKSACNVGDLGSIPGLGRSHTYSQLFDISIQVQVVQTALIKGPVIILCLKQMSSVDQEWRRVKSKRARCEDWVMHLLHECCAKSLQLCPALCDPMDCSPPGSSVHRTLQARRLERAGLPSSRSSSWPRDWTQVSWVSWNGRWVLHH